jgi:hypothetical protein
VSDWDIKPDLEQVEISRQKQYEENMDFYKAFSTPSGKKVLEWLTKHTLDSPTWWPSQSEKFGYFREGQNSLVRQLKSKIQQAKDYQEKNR